MNHKKIAFLLLTYGDHIQSENIKNFLENGNIYVHPKYPKEVHSYLKNYIIENLVETKWGDFSIVNAELNLLEESYKNKENEWFILMSDTCFPLKSFVQLKNILFNKNNNKKNNNYINKSFFLLNGYFNKNNINFYKSSQFWILNRDDVKTILDKKNKYINIFNKTKITDAASDELFFLTLLMNEHNLDYIFNNHMINYSKWINFTFNKHPFIINKLTKIDEDFIINNKCLFIRKISKTFSPIYDNKLKDTLTVFYIDKKINNINTYINNKNTDIIIFYSDNVKDYISEKLIASSLLSINVIYKIYKESYVLFKINNQKYFNQWSNVIFKEII